MIGKLEYAVFALLAAAALSVPIEDARLAPTLEASVGPVELPVPPETALFLLDELDLTAWYLNKRGLLPYTAERVAERRFVASDASGTRGVVELSEREGGRRVWLGEGTHRSRRKLVPELEALAAIAASVEPARAPGCPRRSSIRVDVALRVKNPVLSKLAWLVEGYIREALARRFARATAAARKLAALLAEDPAAVSAELAGFPKLAPAKKAQLAGLARRLPALPQRCR